MNRQVRKEADRLCRMYNEKPEDMEAHNKWLELAKQQAKKEFISNATLGIELMMEFKQIALEKGLYGEKIKQTYFITIRPNEQDIQFQGFYDHVHKFISRKCFKQFELVFEQKATEPPYGKGFHCHILAQMSQRSKGEVLRDVQSTFKHCASANCIQVDIVKTNDDLTRIRGYMLEWKSDDEHKEVTKQADIAWREQLGLLPVYTEPSPGSTARQLSSPVLAGSEIIQSGPYIVHMD